MAYVSNDANYANTWMAIDADDSDRYIFVLFDVVSARLCSVAILSRNMQKLVNKTWTAMKALNYIRFYLIGVSRQHDDTWLKSFQVR